MGYFKETLKTLIKNQDIQFSTSGVLSPFYTGILQQSLSHLAEWKEKSGGEFLSSVRDPPV